jgi:hypothetical protein
MATLPHCFSLPLPLKIRRAAIFDIFADYADISPLFLRLMPSTSAAFAELPIRLRHCRHAASRWHIADASRCPPVYFAAAIISFLRHADAIFAFRRHTPYFQPLFMALPPPQFSISRFRHVAAFDAIADI